MSRVWRALDPGQLLPGSDGYTILLAPDPLLPADSIDLANPSVSPIKSLAADPLQADRPAIPFRAASLSRAGCQGSAFKDANKPPMRTRSTRHASLLSTPDLSATSRNVLRFISPICAGCLSVGAGCLRSTVQSLNLIGHLLD